jgi:putative Mg2+ transporter-C (MgtC) family protein
MNNILQDYQLQLFVLLDVLIAVLLGGVIGYERERKNKPAGLRTHMIISGSAALIYALNEVLINHFNASIKNDALGIDPTRIIHAIIVGVSFIGAGTILKSKQKDQVHNLTTAATILLSATVGISVAMKQYILAVGITLILLLINTIIHKLE